MTVTERSGNMKVARIVKLPKHDNLLIGKDLDSVFKHGHVYEICEVFDGQFIIKDIGETALPADGRIDFPNANSCVRDIVVSESVWRTSEEYKAFREYQRNTSELHSKNIEDMKG